MSTPLAALNAVRSLNEPKPLVRPGFMSVMINSYYQVGYNQTEKKVWLYSNMENEKIYFEVADEKKAFEKIKGFGEEAKEDTLLFYFTP
jgi:hypothetical protein